jgi:hypothetical protein
MARRFSQRKGAGRKGGARCPETLQRSGLLTGGCTSFLEPGAGRPPDSGVAVADFDRRGAGTYLSAHWCAKAAIVGRSRLFSSAICGYLFTHGAVNLV